MIERPSTDVPEEATGNQRLALLLAMAMFVLVVDTSLMNVSISAVVKVAVSAITFGILLRREAAPYLRRQAATEFPDATFGGFGDRVRASVPGRAAAEPPAVGPPAPAHQNRHSDFGI